MPGFASPTKPRLDLVHFLVHNRGMKRVNMHDAKTNLSRYIAELAPGETIILCNRNEPIAELRSLKGKEVLLPKLGVARGLIEIPDSFFDPLPDDILKAFNGESELWNEDSH